MPIKKQSNIDYDALSNELGVTMEELLELVKNKDKYKTQSVEKV